MIIKIKTRNRPSFKQLLEYISDKDKTHISGKQSFIITHNIKGNNIKQWVEQFKENETHRKNKRTDSVYLTHEILSWNGAVAPEKMEMMTREYIRLRGPGMFIAVPHFDKQNNYHVHICTSGVDKMGKSMRLSKANLQKLKKEIQEYQMEKFPELSNSLVKHGKGSKSKMTDAEYQLKQRTNRMTDKEQVLEIVNACFKQATSKVDFFIRLKLNGLDTYIRAGKLTGVLYKNKKHRLGRLGFTEEYLLKLDTTFYRGKELKQLRGKSKDKNINREQTK